MEVAYKKAKTAKGRRFLKTVKAPQTLEPEKTLMLIRGPSRSHITRSAMQEFGLLKNQACVRLSKRNDIRPFENAQSIEMFSDKNEASLFIIDSHNKKRPHHLTIGRTFDYNILDMIELAIINYVPSEQFPSTSMPSYGSKYVFVMVGELFEIRPEYKKFANLMLDMFQGYKHIDLIHLSFLENVIVLYALEDRILWRNYKILLKKSGMKLPRVELQQAGPAFDFRIGRTEFCTKELWKEATRVPKPLYEAEKSTKNITRDIMGKKGQVRLQAQSLKELRVKKKVALTGRSPIKNIKKKKRNHARHENRRAVEES